MPEQILPEPPPPPPNSNPSQNFSTEFDCLPIPPLDPLFFSTDPNSTAANPSDPFLSDLGFGLGLEDDADFDFTFDDLDDLFFPSETEDFLISDGIDPATGSFQSLAYTDVAPESDCSKEFSGDRISNADMVLNSGSPEWGSSQVSGDRGLDVARVLSCPSPESGNSDRELSGGPVSSQGSGNCGPGVSNLGNFDRDVSSNIVVDQKMTMEEIGKIIVSKRKKEKEDPNSESRTTKCRRSSTAENANSQCSLNATDEEEDKKKARLMRNRESAQLSRQRKKHYVDELEDKVRTLHSTIVDLKSKISYIMAENSSLRLQLSNGGGSMCPPPPPGMYPPMTPMAYPWVPYPPYVVNPQGSQVPLVPIPRLKPQQPGSPSKSKKTENKKIKRKTKKVASISFLGLLFFIFLFGGLVPVVNVKFGGIGDGRSGYVSDRFYEQHQGRVLRVNGLLNGSNGSTGVGFSNGKVDIGNRLRCERGHAGGTVCDVEQKERGSQHAPGSDEFVRLGNDSELLVASLYVPRNDKLVKIDGNLIINSVLASEKAMASRSAPEVNNTRETSLAIASGMAPALAIPKGGRNIGIHSQMDGSPTERQRVITSGSEDTLKDHLKSTTTDGKMQQWFREDLAEPLLRSGMCTEVFQFDVSSASAPGAIIPASAINNINEEQPQNATHLKKGRNRRILRGLPLPLARSNLNISEEHVIRNSQKGGFQGNKSSSMVVSVLVDPREAGDSCIDGMIAPKSVSRIFVVVLLDGVKYVTYSCMLPMSGPHLVTT